MAIIDRQMQRITTKVMYFGAIGAGKGANLAALALQSSGNTVPPTGLDAQQSLPQRLCSFRFLPIYAGEFQGLQLRLHLYSWPNEATTLPLLSRLLLTGLDALVFVLSTERHRLAATLRAWHEVKILMQQQGRPLDTLPLVIQYNQPPEGRKCQSPHALRHHFSVQACQETTAIAARGVGTLETLQLLTNQVISRLSLS